MRINVISHMGKTQRITRIPNKDVFRKLKPINVEKLFKLTIFQFRHAVVIQPIVIMMPNVATLISHG